MYISIYIRVYIRLNIRIHIGVYIRSARLCVGSIYERLLGVCVRMLRQNYFKPSFRF